MVRDTKESAICDKTNSPRFIELGLEEKRADKVDHKQIRKVGNDRTKYNIMSVYGFVVQSATMAD